MYLGYVAQGEGEWPEAIRNFRSSEGSQGAPLDADDPILVEPVQLGDDRLTNLDALITRAIEATISTSPGALDDAQLEDVIEEILQNNPQRAKTYFHKGYLDVRLEHPVQPHFRAESPDRRLWYLAGAIRALEDRGDRQGILSLFEKEHIGSLGREHSHRGELAAGPVFKALCEEGRVAAAVEFLSSESVRHTGLFEWTLEFGTKLLQAQEFEAASRIFDLLDLAIKGMSASEIRSLGRLYFDIKRRHAHCLRFQRHFREATTILQELLKDPTAPEHSAMEVDIAVMSLGFRGLLDIEIPEKHLNRFIQRLEQIRPALEAAEARSGDTAHAAYCLGVLSVATQTEPNKAADRLDRSVTNILRHSNEYDLGGLLSRARFYMGLARTEALDGSFVEKSRVLFHEAVSTGFRPPEHLLLRYIVGLSVLSPEQALRVAETAVIHLGASRVLDPMLETEVASRSEAILSSLLQYALGEKRSGSRRFNDLMRILKHAISGSHIEIAFDALDGMEQLAREGICSTDFLKLLDDDRQYHPAWSKSDAAWSAIALNERAGKLVEARMTLEGEFHHTLSDRPYGFLDLAEEIREKIRELGAGRDELAGFERRLNDVRGEAGITIIAEDVDETPVRVTVVGGDERQADYDAAIIGHVATQLGAVKVEFRHTGWSGRWGPQFEEMRPTLDRSDVTVVLRLIRTNLGRRVRDYAKLWIGCAGYSRGSIERAIGTGVEMVRNQRRKSA